MNNTKIEIEHVEVSKLIPYARNSRTHSPSQVKQIAASIREFGFMNPVLIDATNTIIAGHGRVMAAEHLQ
jgi:ParB-like chromosome segregation protein Spo0J